MTACLTSFVLTDFPDYFTARPTKNGKHLSVRYYSKFIFPPLCCCGATCSPGSHLLSATQRGKVVRIIVVVHQPQLSLVPTNPKYI